MRAVAFASYRSLECFAYRARVREQIKDHAPHGRLQGFGAVAFAVRAGDPLLVVLRAGVIEVPAAALLPRGAGPHAPSADAAAEDAAGELPEPLAAVRARFVLKDDLPCRVDDFSGHTGGGNGHGYPLLPGFRGDLDAAAVDAFVARILENLPARPAPAVEPPDPVALFGVEPRCDLRRHKLSDLLEGVRLVAVAGRVESEAVVGRCYRDDPAFSCLAQLPPPGALDDLCQFVLGEPIIGNPEVVHDPEFAATLLKLALQQSVVRRHSRYAVAI